MPTFSLPALSYNLENILDVTVILFYFFKFDVFPYKTPNVVGSASATMENKRRFRDDSGHDRVFILHTYMYWFVDPRRTLGREVGREVKEVDLEGINEKLGRLLPQ